MASDEARALVEAHLGAELETEERESIVVLRLPSTFLELPHSLITEVESVSVPGEYRITLFGLERVGGQWPVGEAVEVSYVTGWDEDEEPRPVKMALTLVDKWLTTDPELGITSVKQEDYSVTRADVGELPKVAKTLLKAFVRPCL